MAIQYDTDEERKLHLSVIHSLAVQYHRDESEIRDIYENRLESLMDGARIKIYLSVLTARYVKHVLNEALSDTAPEMQLNQIH